VIYPGDWDISHYAEHARGTGAAADAVAYVTLSVPSAPGPFFGVGEDGDVVAATFLALQAALSKTVAQSV
jgi:hypothetical protein